MSQPTTSSVVRAILAEDINRSADEVIRRAKADGLKASDKSIRDAVYTVRSELKRGTGTAAAPKPASKPAPKPAPAAARETKADPALTAAAPDLAAVLAAVAQVNAAVGACGGVEPARQAAEAVRECGGVDAFLMHLELVAGIRAG